MRILTLITVFSFLVSCAIHSKKEKSIEILSVAETIKLPGRKEGKKTLNYKFEVVLLAEKVTFSNVILNSSQTTKPKVSKKGETSISKIKTPMQKGDTIIINSSFEYLESFHQISLEYQTSGVTQKEMVTKLTSSKKINLP